MCHNGVLTAWNFSCPAPKRKSTAEVSARECQGVCLSRSSRAGADPRTNGCLAERSRCDALGALARERRGIAITPRSTAAIQAEGHLCQPGNRRRTIGNDSIAAGRED
jgi:hypothetical protein